MACLTPGRRGSDQQSILTSDETTLKWGVLSGNDPRRLVAMVAGGVHGEPG